MEYISARVSDFDESTIIDFLNTLWMDSKRLSVLLRSACNPGEARLCAQSNLGAWAGLQYWAIVRV